MPQATIHKALVPRALFCPFFQVCWKQVLRAERAQRRSLQERLDEAQKNYAVCRELEASGDGPGSMRVWYGENRKPTERQILSLLHNVSSAPMRNNVHWVLQKLTLCKI